MTGNLTKDPEAYITQSGIKRLSFTIAVNRRYANAQGVHEADFIHIVTWKQLADLCEKYLFKGKKVAVEGSIQTRSYDGQDGQKRIVTEIIAENVEFLSNERRDANGSGTALTVQQTDDNVQAASTEMTESQDDELPF